jgi:hypothetical protein
MMGSPIAFASSSDDTKERISVQVLAFSTPVRPEWRWRIVNYKGEMVEESYETFRSIAMAVTEGMRRMDELNVKDLAERTRTFARSPSYLRTR